MQPAQKLDLCGIVVPICYFVFKRALSTMESGAVLEVRLQDPDTLQDLITMIGRSADEVDGVATEPGCFLLRVRKGPPGDGG